MKLTRILLLFFSITHIACNHAHTRLRRTTRQKEFSRTYMLPRPAYDHRPMIQSQWAHIIHQACAQKGFQIIPFFQKSLHQDKTTQYFLPECRTKLLVSGDAVAENLLCRDVRAEWIGLPENFSGILKIKPEQQQMGFSLAAHQHLSEFFDISLLKNWYVGLHIPFVVVDNTLNLTQEQVRGRNETGIGPRDIIEAFKQNEWRYGKLYTGTKTELGLGEITVVLGSQLQNEHFHFYYETLIGLATGTKSNPEYLFSPFVGNNSHWEFGGDIGTEFAINNCRDKYQFYLFADLATRYLFQNKQCRTFDLKNKNWSRFMMMNKRCPGNNSQNVPGVNMLTLDVRVKPFNITDFSTGFRLYAGKFHVELGYNLWEHSDERIRIDEELKEEFGIAGRTAQTTASKSTIAQLAETDDDNFTLIHRCDIDIDSAQSAKAQNHKIFFSTGVDYVGDTCNYIFGFGAFLDVPQKNNPLKMWGVWTKLGATF